MGTFNLITTLIHIRRQKNTIKVPILCIGSSDAIPFTGRPPSTRTHYHFLFLNKNFSRGWGVGRWLAPSPFNFYKKNKTTRFEEH